MKRTITVIIFIIVAFTIGLLLGGNDPKPSMQEVSHNHENLQPGEVWTCSMHPQIRMSEPGKCPICGMDLIPVSDGEGQNSEERELKMSPAAIKLAEIQTTKVVRKYVPAEIRLTGKVDYDETAVKNITAWIPGRLDRLFVDYTGIAVKKGDHMVSLYSPELLTAQEDLILARESAGKSGDSSTKIMREASNRILEATREKLRLWGLTPEQINNIEKKGKSSDHVTIYSPISGIVINKNVDEGAYVDTGTKLYTVADMTKLWIMLDAYESDILWLRYGQEADIKTEAYPDEIFKGKISFISPSLDEITRTIKVRVNVSNKDGKLKPGMLVKSVIRSRVARSGKVMDEALAGKWICPMHPEVIKDNKGDCDICGMPLVTSESLGYAVAGDTSKEKAPLTIPASAPLITGKRAVVYVAKVENEGVFEGREVILGPRVGDSYIVKEGLNEGEMVVTNGNFKIDSALQILAKPSMMSPEGGAVPSGHAHHAGVNPKKSNEKSQMNSEQLKDNFEAPDKFRDQIDNVLSVYFKIQEALSKDDAAIVTAQGKLLKNAIDNVDMTLLKGDSHMAWMKNHNILNEHAAIIGSVSDIEKQRISFEPLSETLKSAVKKFGTGGKHTVIVFHCPMAFNNKGADWLQDNPDLKNPYFGNMMLTCGEKKETLVTGNNNP